MVLYTQCEVNNDAVLIEDCNAKRCKHVVSYITYAQGVASAQKSSDREVRRRTILYSMTVVVKRRNLYFRPLKYYTHDLRITRFSDVYHTG